MEQLTHRVDVMDERQTREEVRLFNRRGHGSIHGEALKESYGDAKEDWEDEEDQEMEDCWPRIRHFRQNFHLGRGRHGIDNQALNEPTKMMKVDVPDFYDKLEPNTIEDQLTTIDDDFN